MTSDFFLATVGKVYSDGLTLIFDTETEPTAKRYAFNRAVTFKPQQRVVVAKISGSYVVVSPISGSYKPGSVGLDGATFKPQISADGILSWTNTGGYANPAPRKVDGTTYIPAVSAEGVISWSNDGGETNPAPVDLTAAVLAALPKWDGGAY